MDRILYTDIKTELVELLIEKEQKIMAASVLTLEPILDTPNVEFAAGIPRTTKIRRMTGA